VYWFLPLSSGRPEGSKNVDLSDHTGVSGLLQRENPMEVILYQTLELQQRMSPFSEIRNKEIHRRRNSDNDRKYRTREDGKRHRDRDNKREIEQRESEQGQGQEDREIDRKLEVTEKQ